MHPHSHPCPHFVLCGAVEDIIWEVDEDANGWIDWENFVQMYIRCQNDHTVSICLLRASALMAYLRGMM